MAPNRPLDLERLERPEHRRVLVARESLAESDPVWNLHRGKRREYPSPSVGVKLVRP